jgi:hypothetical protein
LCCDEDRQVVFVGPAFCRASFAIPSLEFDTDKGPQQRIQLSIEGAFVEVRATPRNAKEVITNVNQLEHYKKKVIILRYFDRVINSFSN